MPKKKDLLEKLCKKPIPKNFTIAELDVLMSKSGCEKGYDGRGSSISYYHESTKKILQFDKPHPGKELYTYHIKKIIQFLKDVGEL